MRYVETVLYPGDEVVAVGRATIKVSPVRKSRSFREPPVVCYLQGTDEPG
jgi:hypothetical protein